MSMSVLLVGIHLAVILIVAIPVSIPSLRVISTLRAVRWNIVPSIPVVPGLMRQNRCDNLFVVFLMVGAVVHVIS